MNRPVSEVMRRRRSVRSYEDRPIAGEVRRRLEEHLTAGAIGPLGNGVRLALVASEPGESEALRGLGTYGMIKGATGFMVGAVGSGPGSLEDFGYLVERAVLEATDLGLGTCWLGGTFTKSRFAKKIAATGEETVPAVVAVGYGREGARDRIREVAGSSRRLPAEQLFFADRPGHPLDTDAAGPYREILECVRWAPSASNKQPWRLVRTEERWHFYLQRTKGYGKGSLMGSLVRLADIQRVDMGIAMCHFELAAREAGLTGRWQVRDPGPAVAEQGWEYTAGWYRE